MKIKTINSIEVTSLCNLSCEYCPNRLQHKHRKTGHMNWETFEQAIHWARHFCNQGTQLELNLFGIGEPTLHPQFVDMIHYAKKVLPFQQVIHFNTNGVTMTEELAKKIMDAGIDHIDLTGHSPYHTAKSIRIFRKLGIKGQISMDPIIQPNNWAGQVDWFESEVTYPCPWLRRGQVMVYSDGDITTCCLDAFKQGVVGNIYDENVPDIELKPFGLCEHCHQIP